MYGRLPHPPLLTMAIATLAIATVSLCGTISLCTVRNYMDLILTFPRWRMSPQNYQQKIHPTFVISLHIFWFDFKPLTFIRNNIGLILHVRGLYIIIWNVMKIGEKQRTMLASVQRVVSYSPCVWYQTSECCTILPGKLMMGDFKIFVQNKIFSQPTDLTFWAVCNRNQTIIFVQSKHQLHFKWFSLKCEVVFFVLKTISNFC